MYLFLNHQTECNFCSQLKLSTLVAHKTYYLVLLPSGPDTVHNHLLHKTQFSTLLTKITNFNLDNPRTNITLAIARKYRKLLAPRLHGTVLLYHIAQQLSNGYKKNARNRNRTGTGFNSRRILSPVRLPVPPFEHNFKIKNWERKDSNLRKQC